MRQFRNKYSDLAKLTFASCLVILAILLFKPTSTLLAQHFDPPQEWHQFFCVGNQICSIGDFDGDGDDDIVAFLGDNAPEADRGKVYVSVSTGTGFAEAQLWQPSFCTGDQICMVGDFNGDGRDDIGYFTRETTARDDLGQWWVSISLGAMFGPAQRWPDVQCGGNVCVIGDFNGDKADDVAVLMTTQDSTGTTGVIHVVPSTNVAFTDTVISGNTACVMGENCQSADVNGDGLSDIIRVAGPGSTNPGEVWVALSNGTDFQTPLPWHADFCAGVGVVCTVGDFNGDQQADLLRFQGSDNNGSVDVAFSTGSAFESPVTFLQFFCTDGELCMVTDANGDGIDDVIAFVRGEENTPNRGKVYVSLMGAGPPPPMIAPVSGDTTGFTPLSLQSPTACVPGTPGCTVQPMTATSLPTVPPTTPPVLTPTACVPGTPGCTVQPITPTPSPIATPTCVPGTPGCTTGEVPGGD